MAVTGSESENGLFLATVTTGKMAAVAAASFGFYMHDAVARLLLRSSDNNAGNARVEGRLSKMEQSMQQQQQRETSVLNQMSVSLDRRDQREAGALGQGAGARTPPPASSSSAALEPHHSASRSTRDGTALARRARRATAPRSTRDCTAIARRARRATAPQ